MTIEQELLLFKCAMLALVKRSGGFVSITQEEVNATENSGIHFELDDNIIKFSDQMLSESCSAASISRKSLKIQ